jgi:cation transport regulator ChaC
VVTLVEAPGEVCEGRAFLVEPEVFSHLDHREKNGYERVPLEIVFDTESVSGVTYRAPEGNPAFLGPAPAEDIAEQVYRSHGPSGSNAEYVIELARSLRQLGVGDRHVFQIEALLRQLD